MSEYDSKSILEYQTPILHLFFNRKRKLLFAIALHRILEQLTKQGAKCDSNLRPSNGSKSSHCWICWKKEILFSLHKRDGSTYQPSSKKSEKMEHDRLDTDAECKKKAENIAEWQKKLVDVLHEIRPNGIDPKSSEVAGDELGLWKLVEEWFDLGAEDETNDKVTISNVSESSDVNQSKEIFLKTIFAEVLKQLETAKRDQGIVSETPLALEEKPDCFSFAVRTNLTAEELEKFIPSAFYIHRNIREKKTVCWVTVDVCRKCLKQISFENGHKNEGPSRKIHYISLLIDHLSSLATQRKSSSDVVAVPETSVTQVTPNETRGSNTPTQPGLNRIQITVVHDKSRGKLRVLKPRFSEEPLDPASKAIQPPNPPLLPFVFPPVLSSQIASSIETGVKKDVKATTGFEKDVKAATGLKKDAKATIGFKKIVTPTCSNGTLLAPGPVLNMPKPNHFRFPIKNYSRTGHFRVLKLIKNSNSRLIKTSKTSGGFSHPTTMMLGHNFVKRKTVQTFSAKPLATLCPNSVVSQSKVLQFCPRWTPVNNNFFSVVHSPSLFNKQIFKPIFKEEQSNQSALESAKQVQSNKRKRTASHSNARKRIKKEKPPPDSSAESTDTSASKKVNVENSLSKTSQGSPKKAKSVGNRNCSKAPLRVKVPSKKKTLEKQQVDLVPMKTIISNYLATTINENNTAPFSRPTNRVRQRHTKSKSAKKLIPIPYESHYLCIYETLAKKGWKAYWYQKCRCARGEKKKAEETVSSESTSEPVSENEDDQVHVGVDLAPVTSNSMSFNNNSSKCEPMSSSTDDCTASTSHNVKDQLQTPVNSSLDRDSVSENEDDQVHVDFAPVTSNSMNCNNNSSKCEPMSSSTDDYTASTSHTVKDQLQTPVNSSLDTDSVKQRASKRKSGDVANAIRRMIDNAKKSLADCELETSNISKEKMKLDPTLNDFARPKAKKDCNTSVKAFKLHTLTAKDIENALSQLDLESCVKIEDTDELETDIAESDTEPIPAIKKVPKPKVFKTAAPQVQNRKKKVSEKVEATTKALNDRQKKVDAVVRMLAKKSKFPSNSKIVDRLVVPHVFAQCFEEIDKQPGCLDLISVDPVLLEDSPKLCRKVVAVHKQRESRNKSLLNATKAKTLPTANKNQMNDLECIWAFGKLNSFFTENPVSQSYTKTKKNKLPKRPVVKTSAHSAKPYLTFKRTMKKFSNNKAPMRKIYKHHSRRPKAQLPLVRFEEIAANQSKREEHSAVGIEPYILRWDIPKTSRSEVVGQLEDVWGEISGFSGLFGEQLPSSNGTLLTPDRVFHALTAMKNCSKMFTFSSKPKNGKNTVLLICRKVKDNSEENEKVESGVRESIPSSATATNVDNASESSSTFGPSKLRLKLKKTGEVSGSAIYSVSDSEDSQDEFESLEQDNYDVRTEDSEDTNSVFDASFASANSRFLHASPTKKNDLIRNVFQSDQVLFPKSEASNDENVDACNLHSEISSISSNKITLKPFSSHANDLSFFSPLRSNQSSLESDFDRSFSELDIQDEVTNVMHSTMLNDSPRKSKMSKSEFGHLKDVEMSDLATLNSFLEKQEFKIVDWDGKMEGNDALEELLLSMDETSLDALEDTFVSEENLHISPSKLQRILKQKSQKFLKKKDNKICLEKRNPVSRFNVSCSFAGKTFFDNSLTSPYEFKENFSSFDSPEAIRGNSYSKSTENAAALPLNESFDESINLTPPRNTRSSAGGCVQANDEESKPVTADSMIKSCNVLLEPLEEVLEDLNGSQEYGEETLNTSSKIRFTESSVRELNRLLKNRALNGAYWRSIEVDSSSSASSQSSGRWCFRDRNKKKVETASEEFDVDINVEGADVEKDEVQIDEEQEPEVIYPKRKNLGRVKHYRPSLSELKQRFHEIYLKSANDAVKRSETTSSKMGKKRKSLGKALQPLLESEMNFTEVRRWIVESSLPHPPPLRFRPLVARKTIPIKKPLSVKVSVRVVDEPKESTQTDAKKRVFESPKKMKKINPDSSRHVSKVVENEEFINLRQQLFRLRHPDYKGDICSSGKMRPIKFDAPTCRVPLTLIRVSAEEAKKQDEPSLSTDIMMQRKSRAEKALSRQRQSQNSSGASSNTLINAYPESSLPILKVPKVSLDSIVSVSSRGRAIKPSIRSHQLEYEIPKGKKRRRSEDTKVASPPPPPPPPQPSKYDYRHNRRFVNRHSSSGLFIKKIIESGLYE